MVLNKKKNILVIEDDIDIRELITEILTYEGHQVAAAENGKIGLDYLEACSVNDRPDCIILDLMMPVMTGLELLDVLQEKHPRDLAKIPVIIITAKDLSKEQLINLPKNVIKFKKPMDVHELINVVAKHSSYSENSLTN